MATTVELMVYSAKSDLESIEAYANRIDHSIMAHDAKGWPTDSAEFEALRNVSKSIREMVAACRSLLPSKEPAAMPVR